MKKGAEVDAVGLPPGKAAQHRGVEPVFGGEHPCGQSVGRVAGFHRHAGLAEDRAAVEFRRDQMHRRPGLRIACGERAGMGVQPRIFRQQRGVDVQHPSAETRHELRGQDPHEPGEAQDVGLRRQQRLEQRGLERGAVAAEGAVIDRGGGDVHRRSAGKPGGRRVVRRHQHRPRRMVAGHRADQLHHVRAAAGNQDRDAPGCVLLCCAHQSVPE